MLLGGRCSRRRRARWPLAEEKAGARWPLAEEKPGARWPLAEEKPGARWPLIVIILAPFVAHVHGARYSPACKELGGSCSLTIIVLVSSCPLPACVLLGARRPFTIIVPASSSRKPGARGSSPTLNVLGARGHGRRTVLADRLHARARRPMQGARRLGW
ncbi:hypothetical protein Dimus_039053 [Dionaea muscipula]